MKSPLRGIGAGALSLLLAFGSPVFAETSEMQSLKDQLKALSTQMESLKAQIDKADQEKKVEITELQQRVDKTELHTVTDKIQWGIDFRQRMDSIHYDNVAMAPSSLTNAFFTPVSQGGFNGATPQQIQQAIQQMASAGMIPPPEKKDFDNDSLFTSRARFNMKAKANEHLDFQGRMTAYKTYGDSTEVKQFNGLNDVTFDGNDSSLPRGDVLRLERAYFDLKGDWNNMPLNLSLGRRPSTEGSPLEYQNNSMIGGSPLAHIINWQFDGASASAGLEDVTGIPGASMKLCWGVGFESGYYDDPQPINNVDDVQLAGFIAQLYDDGLTVATVNYAHAFDITDGFAGTTVPPFIATQNPDGTMNFAPNSGNYVSVVNPATEIGDWDALDLLVTHNAKESLGVDVDVFSSVAWSHTNPSRVSNIPFYNLTGQGLLSSNGDLQERDGYSVYSGVRVPVYKGSKLGFEHNYGTKNWFNFTGAEDSLVGSKLAVRGHVFETYFIQPIFDDTFFLTLGARYYDYQYSGSGNPLGAPVKISDINSLDAINPVYDNVWDFYVSATLRM